MSDKLTRTSLNFEFFKRINTDRTPFETILYFFKDSNNLIVEDPAAGTCFITWKNEIKNYFTLADMQTAWEPLIDGSWMRIHNQQLIHILPLKTQLELVHLSFVIQLHNQELDMIRNIKEKNFEVKKNRSETRKDHGLVTVDAYLPIWPFWAKITRSISKSSDTKIYSLNRIYMNINGEFYRFPYGNVNGSDGVCLGGSNMRTFEKLDEIWLNFITTPFNTDYAFNIRANRINVPDRTYRDRNALSPIRINIPTFNLEEIFVRLSAKAYEHVSFLDTIYYLSHIEDFDEFDPLDILYKLPYKPWEGKD